MSKILIFLDSDLSAKEKVDISKITNSPLIYITNSVKSNRPFKNYLLFMNDYPEVAETLTKLVTSLDSQKFRIFEVEDNFQFSNIEDIINDEISPQILLNILETANQYN